MIMNVNAGMSQIGYREVYMQRWEAGEDAGICSL